MSKHSRMSTGSQFTHDYIVTFLEWMGKFVTIPDSGDYFHILSDFKYICLLIVRVCPAQALVSAEALEHPGVDIQMQYSNICKRLDIPVDYCIKPEIFVYRDMHSLFTCLQALISSIILYVDPESVQLPPLLTTHLHEPSCISSYREESVAYTNPSETYSYGRTVSSFAKDAMSMTEISLDSDRMTTVSDTITNDYSGIPGMCMGEQPLFTPTQAQNQSSRQSAFLKELEEDKRLEKELSVDPMEQERFSSNQLGSPRDSSSYRSIPMTASKNLNESNAIAEEVIEPRDKYVEQQTKKKNFWKKVAAVGAAIGVVAGTVLAVAAATKNSSKGYDDDSDYSYLLTNNLKTHLFPMVIRNQGR